MHRAAACHIKVVGESFRATAGANWLLQGLRVAVSLPAMANMWRHFQELLGESLPILWTRCAWVWSAASCLIFFSSSLPTAWAACAGAGGPGGADHL